MSTYSVDTEPGNALVVLRVHVDTDADLAVELTRAAARHTGDAGVRCCLVDMRGTRNVASDLSDYDLAYAGFEGLGLPRYLRIALLVDEGDRSRDFFETLASNAGYSLRVFRQDDAARQWLLRR